MRETATKIGHAAGMGLVLCAVVLAVLFVAPGLVGAEAAFVVDSDSMSPAIDAGDVVVVHDTAPTTIAEGDVITYRSDRPAQSAYVTHRVVGVEESGQRHFRTKGDANEQPDPELVSPAAVVGEVGIVLPLVGHLVVFASTDLGMVVFIVLPAVAFVVMEARALYRDATVESDTTGAGE